MSFHHQAKIVTDSLLYYYDFKNPKCYPGTGNTCRDLVSNLDASIGSTVVYENGYFKFIGFGVENYISANAINPIGKTQVSINTWALHTTGGQGSMLFCNDSGPLQFNGVIMQTGAGADNSLVGYQGNTGTSYAQAANCITPNVWFNYTMVYDGSQPNDLLRIKIYVNGLLRVRSTGGAIPTSIPTTTTGKISIGKHTSSARYWVGNIGVVAWYDKALNEVEILQNYNALKSRYI
jgi:hypothetical protein